MEKLKILFQNTLYIAYPLLTGVEGSEKVLNKWQQFYQDVERDLQEIYNSTYSSQTFERLVKWVSKKGIFRIISDRHSSKTRKS